MREQQPTCAIFWVPAISRNAFEQAYRDMGILLQIPGIDDAETDVKQLVRARLSDEAFGRWLMIIDNADDITVLFSPLQQESGAARLIDSLPQSRKGFILFTTRTREAAIKLAGNNVIALGELEKSEAREVLTKSLLQEHQYQLEDDEIIDEFLNTLAFLALAIVQAVAFMNTNGVAISDYISHYKSSEKDATNLLSKEFEDQGRYRDAKNPVITTWFVSFEHILKQNPLAGEHLSFMACTASNNVPASMLPLISSTIEQVEAFGKLKAYAFITERQPQRDGQKQTATRREIFDVHPLVHLAMRSWLKAMNQWEMWGEIAMTRLVELLPESAAEYQGFDKEEIYKAYLTHAFYLVDPNEDCNRELGILLLLRVAIYSMALGRKYLAAAEAHKELFDGITGLSGNPNVLGIGDEHKELQEEKDKLKGLVEGLEKLFRLTNTNS